MQFAPPAAEYRFLRHWHRKLQATAPVKRNELAINLAAHLLGEEVAPCNSEERGGEEGKTGRDG